MQDMTCFSSFVFKLRNSLWSDGAVCKAPLPEWSYNYLPLSKAIKIKMWKQVLPQPPFRSSKVLKQVELDQCKVRKDKSLVIQDRVERDCEYPFVTAEESATVRGYRRLCKASEKMYRSYLGPSSEKILPTMTPSVLSTKK